MAVKKAKARPRRQLEADLPPGLNPEQYEFCLAYLAGGFNATAAYKAAYPGCKVDASARTAGWRLLTNVDIKRFMASQLEDRWRPLQMSGDEALALIAQDARVDIRTLFDEAGNLLKPHLWPDAISGSVKAVQDGPYGLKVTLVDPLSARRIILEVTGKVKGVGDSIDALAAAIRADREQHGIK